MIIRPTIFALTFFFQLIRTLYIDWHCLLFPRRLATVWCPNPAFELLYKINHYKPLLCSRVELASKPRPNDKIWPIGLSVMKFDTHGAAVRAEFWHHSNPPSVVLSHCISISSSSSRLDALFKSSVVRSLSAVGSMNHARLSGFSWKTLHLIKGPSTNSV